MRAALRAEYLKLTRSMVGIIATAALVAGTVALLAGITAALASGNRQLAAKAGPGATLDWTGLLSAAAQITAVGGLLTSGIVLAWLFGREFTDATIAALFALPVTRGRIALAKFIIHLAWVLGVNLVLTATILVLGLLLGYGAPSIESWSGLARHLALGIFSGITVLPVAWLTSVTRSLLAGVGGCIGLMIAAQAGTMAGIGGWIPPAVPALWAMGNPVSPVQLATAVAIPALCVLLTRRSWEMLQLDR